MSKSAKVVLGSNSLNPPYQGGSETDRSEIVACQPVIAGCDPPEALQPIESGLDAPAQLVETLAEAKRLVPVGAVWDDRFDCMVGGRPRARKSCKCRDCLADGTRRQKGPRTPRETSGEWLSFDWPRCPLTETSTPQRMGAALTYVRRGRSSRPGKSQADFAEKSGVSEPTIARLKFTDGELGGRKLTA